MNHMYFYFFDGNLPNLIFQLQLIFPTPMKMIISTLMVTFQP